MICEQPREYDCAPVAFYNYFTAVGIESVDLHFLTDVLQTDSFGTDDDAIEAMIALINTRIGTNFKLSDKLRRDFTWAFLVYEDDGGDDHIAFAINKPGYIRIYNSQLQANRLDFEKKEVFELISKDEHACAYTSA